MSDNDLIRRGDALAVIDALKAEFEAGGSPTAAMVLDLAREHIAALDVTDMTEPVTHVRTASLTFKSTRKNTDD